MDQQLTHRFAFLSNRNGDLAVVRDIGYVPGPSAARLGVPVSLSSRRISPWAGRPGTPGPRLCAG